MGELFLELKQTCSSSCSVKPLEESRAMENLKQHEMQVFRLLYGIMLTA